jgi:hypothetical protein
MGSEGEPPAAATRQAATRPTTTSAPATTRPARLPLGKDLERRWRWYKTTWAGTSIRNQSLSDQQLVNAILGADPAEVATLRDLMIQEYQRLAAPPQADNFPCGRMASRIALAWTKVPMGKDLSAIQFALNRKLTCDEVVGWAERALGHFAGGIEDKYWQRYRSFLPGTVASMMSLIPSRAPMLDEPGKLRDRLRQLRPQLEGLSAADEAGQAQFKQQLEKLYAALEPLDKLQADKQAVGKLLLAFRDAYNQRDDKAFEALWPKGHPATKFLQNRPLASKIEPSHWTIVRWEPVYTVAMGDFGAAYVISQYRSRDGTVHEAKLQRFPFKRHKQEGWKLN